MHLLKLPTEIRLRIYEELLACQSAVVEFVLHRMSTIKPRFQIRTVHPLAPQLLRVCRQIHVEALPVLYGSHQFDCAFSTLGIEDLHAQIGPTNFGLVKHLIIGWSDMQRLSCSFQDKKTAQLYKNLETLTIGQLYLISLNRRRNILYSDLRGLSDYCKTAREILSRHPLLRVLAQTSIEDYRTMRESDTVFLIKWTLHKSPSTMLPDVPIHGKLPT